MLVFNELIKTKIYYLSSFAHRIKMDGPTPFISVAATQEGSLTVCACVQMQHK